MRKEKRTYYFSVEGKTEQWYLTWLDLTARLKRIR